MSENSADQNEVGFVVENYSLCRNGSFGSLHSHQKISEY